MKLLLENWREYLNEDEGKGPTVGEFLAAWNKQDPKSMQSIFGKAAKFLVGLGGEHTAGALGAVVGGAVGAAAAPVAGPGAVPIGYAAGKLSEKGIDKLFGLVANKSNDLAKFMVKMAQNQVPDGERTGIALYYDLDAEYEALIQGMDSDLAKEWQKHLFEYFESKFSGMQDVEPNEPLSKYIEQTANQHLQDFLADKEKSDVGVAVQKQTAPKTRDEKGG